MIRLTFILILLLTAGCNYNYSKSTDGTDQTNPSVQSLNVRLDFETVYNSVFKSQCLQCHSSSQGRVEGGLSLDSFEQLKPKIHSIYTRSVDRMDMPPSGQKLSPDQMAILKGWLDEGFPEKSSGAKTKKLKGPWSWGKISKDVLADNCLMCHSGLKPEADLDLTQYSVFTEKLPLIISRVFVKQDMPLDPLPKLSLAEKQALMEWISKGLPE